MRDAPFTDRAAVPIKDTDLVALRAPIHPHKPLVGEGLIRVLLTVIYMTRWYHYYISSLARMSRGLYAPQVAVSARPKRNGVMVRMRRQNFAAVPQALSRASENTQWNLSATMRSCL
jgi:hypothetical protein